MERQLRSSPMASLTAWANACSVPRYRSVVWMEACPSSSWICSRSPARLAAQLCARPSQIVWSKLAQFSLFCIPHDQPPDGFLIPDLVAGEYITLVDRPEQTAFCDCGRLDPLINPRLDRGRYRDGPDAVALSFHVRKDPTAFSLLQVVHVEPQELRPAQAAAEQKGEDRSITLAGECSRIRSV